MTARDAGRVLDASGRCCDHRNESLEGTLNLPDSSTDSLAGPGLLTMTLNRPPIPEVPPSLAEIYKDPDPSHDLRGGRPAYYDREGKPMSHLRWMACLGSAPESIAYKRVALDEELDEHDEIIWTVSTVWLGLDHAWGGGPPLIFETMIFVSAIAAEAVQRLDSEQWRYHTEEEALESHHRIVERMRAGMWDSFTDRIHP